MKRLKFLFLSILFLKSTSFGGQNENLYQPIHFSAIADAPYNDFEISLLEKQIKQHNNHPQSKFLVHLGDIKTSQQPCDEFYYSRVADLLKKSLKPVFIIPGDNEINDCENPSQGWEFWKRYFINFEANWKLPFAIDKQKNRSENFAWVDNGVLFMGIHLVGGKIPDARKWNIRLKDSAQWVSHQLHQYKETVRAAVLFAHASGSKMENVKSTRKQQSFTIPFRKAAKSFEKPILYLKGDGHTWVYNRPWPEKNILHVQLIMGGEANLAEIIISTSTKNDIFLIKQQPLGK